MQSCSKCGHCRGGLEQKSKVTYFINPRKRMQDPHIGLEKKMDKTCKKQKNNHLLSSYPILMLSARQPAVKMRRQFKACPLKHGGVNPADQTSRCEQKETRRRMARERRRACYTLVSSIKDIVGESFIEDDADDEQKGDRNAMSDSKQKQTRIDTKFERPTETDSKEKHTHTDTQTKIQTQAFTHRPFYTQKLLYTHTHTHTHTRVTGLRADLQNRNFTSVFDTGDHHFVRKGCAQTCEIVFFLHVSTSKRMSQGSRPPMPCRHTKSTILPQVSTIEPHFVPKGCAGPVKITILL